MRLTTISKAIVAVVLTIGCAGEAFAQKGKQNSSVVGGEGGARGDIEGSSKKVRVKYNSKTDVTFGDTDISGVVKNPFASMLTSRDPNIQSGFLRIRYNWHDMLVMSASGLSQ